VGRSGGAGQPPQEGERAQVDCSAFAETASFPPDLPISRQDEEEAGQEEPREGPDEGASGFEDIQAAAFGLPPADLPPLPDDQLAPFYPGFPQFEIPPFDWGQAGVFACLVNLDQLAQQEIGYGIDDPGFPEALEEAVAGMEDCSAIGAGFGEGRFEAVTAAGAFAWGVATIRDRFGLDLAQIRSGEEREWGTALAQRLNDRGVSLPFQPPPDPQQGAAQRVMSWLPLAQFAGRLNLSTQTQQGLEYVRGAADWLTRLRMPQQGQEMTGMNAYASALGAVRQHLNVDPAASGAWAAVQSIRARAEEAAGRARDTLDRLQRGREVLDRARTQAAGLSAMVGQRGVEAARGIAHQAASRIMQGLPTSPSQVPVLQRALPVLSTAASVRQATGRSPVRRRSSAPRRTGQG
jgi:hypothetical protein